MLCEHVRTHKLKHVHVCVCVHESDLCVILCGSDFLQEKLV